MYRHCIYCSAELKSLLEGIPGRRFAFDSEAARAWVVCLRCARWSFLPASIRHQAREALESEFDLAARVLETDNVEMRRAEDGLTLIHIGSAGDEERAAWRYAGVGGFRSFWSGELKLAGMLVGMCAFPALLMAPLWVAGGLGIAGPVAAAGVGLGWWRMTRREQAPILRIAGDPSTSTAIVLGNREVQRSRLVAEGGVPGVLLPAAGRATASSPLRVTGDDLRLLLMRLLPRRSPGSASETDLIEALAWARETGDAQAQLRRLAEDSPLLGFGSAAEADSWNTLPRAQAIALEVTLQHEMEADTAPALLERAWLEAGALATDGS